jgi:hypothetical protein
MTQRPWLPFKNSFYLLQLMAPEISWEGSPSWSPDSVKQCGGSRLRFYHPSPRAYISFPLILDGHAKQSVRLENDLLSSREKKNLLDILQHGLCVSIGIGRSFTGTLFLLLTLKVFHFLGEQISGKSISQSNNLSKSKGLWAKAKEQFGAFGKGWYLEQRTKCNRY